MSWFLNTLHRDLGGTRKRQSIITKIFQGMVRVDTQSILVKEDNDEPLAMDIDRDITTTVSPFMFLTLDLPPPPLFQDEVERNIIPQIPLSTLLGKYDGQRTQEVSGYAKRFHLLKLPRYVIFHIKRFTKNNWTFEKNPTIVNFPIRNIDLSELLSKEQEELETVEGHYDLIANISHEGKPGAGQGAYKVHVRHRGKDQWFQIQDLIVEEIIPQMIFLSESFIQIWERKPISKGKNKET
ncbi:Ubiquitin carboxyl-terminal hydrolase 10 [Basidiobolus ranarum]|uniref:Ubiquitin carboxyl-terminal hydrolase 10 n=1 Tax=Basidiobolus ranarum TaxID=34480 RepID=A0ABR2W3Q8_9FUNG